LRWEFRPCWASWYWAHDFSSSDFEAEWVDVSDFVDLFVGGNSDVAWAEVLLAVLDEGFGGLEAARFWDRANVVFDVNSVHRIRRITQVSPPAFPDFRSLSLHLARSSARLALDFTSRTKILLVFVDLTFPLVRPVSTTNFTVFSLFSTLFKPFVKVPGIVFANAKTVSSGYS
jgi:hypothetical protein